MPEASAAPAQSDAPSGLNLQVVSPSASVSRPLVFPGIPASTTIRQLKEKIRDAVASRPADDQQRLIHRGRLLARDDETLGNILGAEAVQSGEQQTLHLVLRDLSDHHPAPSQATPLRGQSPAPGSQSGNQQRTQQAPHPQQPHVHHHHHHHPHQHIHAGHAFPPGNRPLTAPIVQMPPFLGMPPMPFQYNGPFHPPGAADPAIQEQLANEAHRFMANMMNQNQPRAATPVGGARASSNPPPHGRDPTQIAAQLALQLAQNAQQQEALANQAEQITLLLNNPLTNQPNRPAASQQFVNQATNLLNHGQRLMAQQLVNQGQRERAAAGLHGVQDNGPAHVQGQTGDRSGRNSPAVGHPLNVTREVVTPDGHFIRVTTTVNGQVVTTQNGQPVQAPPGRQQQNSAAGSSSGAAPAAMPIQPIAPGVTTSIFENQSRQPSRMATPDPSQRTQNHGSSAVPASAQPAALRQASQVQPEVYIMSSPTGPHALLLANGSTYVTPQAIQQPNGYSIRGTHILSTYNPAGLRERAPRQGRLQTQDQQHRQAAPRPPAGGNNQVNPALDVHQHRHPPNVGAAAVLAAVWPHVWLLIRLAAFVWWFTASDSSWSRWIAVVLIAIGVFAVNTGLFNNVAHQAWDPFRRHLEGLLLPGIRPAVAVVVPPPGDAADPPPQAAPQGGAAAGDRAADPAGAAPDQHQRPARDPDPAEAAARLVERRRQHNAGWVMEQIRRVERAGLLFLASIAPGVAERHIAHLEEQERIAAAQETARREAEAAAEAAARAQQVETRGEGAEDQGAAHGGSQPREAQGQEQGQEPAEAQRQQERPLIGV